MSISWNTGYKNITNMRFIILTCRRLQSIKVVNCTIVLNQCSQCSLGVWERRRDRWWRREGTGETQGMMNICIILTMVVISQRYIIHILKVTKLYTLNVVALFWAVQKKNTKTKNPFSPHHPACCKAHWVSNRGFLVGLGRVDNLHC